MCIQGSVSLSQPVSSFVSLLSAQARCATAAAACRVPSASSSICCVLAPRTVAVTSSLLVGRCSRDRRKSIVLHQHAPCPDVSSLKLETLSFTCIGTHHVIQHNKSPCLADESGLCCKEYCCCLYQCVKCYLDTLIHRCRLRQQPYACVVYRLCLLSTHWYYPESQHLSLPRPLLLHLLSSHPLAHPVTPHRSYFVPQVRNTAGVPYLGSYTCTRTQAYL